MGNTVGKILIDKPDSGNDGAVDAGHHLFVLGALGLYRGGVLKHCPDFFGKEVLCIRIRKHTFIFGKPCLIGPQAGDLKRHFTGIYCSHAILLLKRRYLARIRIASLTLPR